MGNTEFASQYLAYDNLPDKYKKKIENLKGIFSSSGPISVTRIEREREKGTGKSKDYKSVHIGYKGRRAMYKDFIDEYVSYPKELKNKLKYPAAGGQHIIDVGEVIPENLKEFMYKVAGEYQDNGHKVTLYQADPHAYNGGKHIYDEEPFGEYTNNEVNSEMYVDIKNEVKEYFSDGRDTITLMARIRDRNRGENTGGCYLNWNPDSWEIFLDRVINELDTNIVVINLSTSGAAGGAMSFEGTKLYEDNNSLPKIDKLKSLIKKKDINNALKLIESKYHEYLNNIFSCTGNFIDKQKKLEKLKIDEQNSSEINNIINIRLHFS